MRPNRGGRAPSGPWGRLKPVDQDPLDSMGLPSKGDTRLLDFKAQERHYTKIVERYMTFCSDAGERDELLRRFASLELESSPGPSSNIAAAAAVTATGASSTSGSTSTPSTKNTPSPSATQAQLPGSATATATHPANTKPLSDVMMALRKLREGIVASHRADEFAAQAYLFNIRLSVLTKHPESYHPAILHVLRRIHPLHPLTSVELHEVVAYLVLDTACRRADLAEAYALRRRHGLRDAKVDAVLAALTHDNYAAFRRVKRSVDGHRARLLDYADTEMRRHTLKCFGRTYLTVEKDFLERCTGSTWAELTERDSVGWDLDRTNVVIRKVKAR